MLETVRIGEDQVIRLGEVALVSSKSVPGSWHRTGASACDCKGYLYRGHCRHIAAVRELERAEIRASVAASPVLESANARRLALEARRAEIVASVSDLFE